VSDNIGTNTWQGSAGPPPLTRRELREREQREALASAAQTAVVPVVEQPPVVSVPDHGGQQVLSSPQPPPAVPQETARPMTRRERREWEERMRMEQEASTAVSAVAPPAPQPVAATVDTGVSVVNDFPAVSEPSVTSGRHRAIEEPASPAAAPLPPVFDIPVAPPRSGFSIAIQDLETNEAELASSREVGAGSPATHALILPTMPTIDISGPIGDTGEIIITGQIPLPRLVTETGVEGNFEEDERFDELIGGEITPMTSPVSARSAVSSKGNDSEFQMVRKAPWGTAATILGTSAVLLVLAAAGLLGVALLTDLLTWPF
jgi:hypothetical protein